MLANTLFPVITLPKIHICGDRRTPRVAVRREASFMVEFLLTGLTALPRHFVYPKIMLKVLFYLFWQRASVEDSPLPNFLFPSKRTEVLVNFVQSSEGVAGPVCPSMGSVSVAVAAISVGHWRLSGSAFWEASFSSPDSGVPDGNVNRKLGPSPSSAPLATS